MESLQKVRDFSKTKIYAEEIENIPHNDNIIQWRLFPVVQYFLSSRKNLRYFGFPIFLWIFPVIFFVKK
jgi:hypothetical protein